MNKFLHCLLAIAALSPGAGLSAASAGQLSVHDISHIVPSAETETSGAQATTQTMTVGYCLEPSISMGTGKGTRIGGALQLNAATVAMFAGNKITAVLVANGSTKSTTATSAPIEVFCTKTLDGTPIATASGQMDYTNTKKYNTYEFASPITIEEGQPLYIGFIAEQQAADEYPLTADGYPGHDAINEPGGFYGLTDDYGDFGWSVGPASQYGYPCVKVIIEGESMPTDMCRLSAIGVPYSTDPEQPFTAEIEITNTATNEITSVGISYRIADGEPQTATADLAQPIGYGVSAVVSFPVTYPAEGNNVKFEATVATVNGRPNGAPETMTSASTTFLSLSPENGFQRNMVVEEATGTWCGWCPRGIVGMEKMKELHSDGTFIPIAVHGNYSATQRDPMTSSSYTSLINNVGGGFPASLINRNKGYYGIVDPDFDNFKAAYADIVNRPAVAKVEIDSIERKSRTTDIYAKVTFGISEPNATYRLAYVITEDEVGPYNQSNYYSYLSQNMPLEGWQDKEPYVSTIYNDVARAISSYNGTANSIPASVTAGEPVTHRGSVSSTAVKNYKNAHYIALLINTTTGCIENAVLYTPSDPSSITDIEADADPDAPVRYYNLQGVEVADPVYGHIYIRRQGSSATKIRF